MYFGRMFFGSLNQDEQIRQAVSSTNVIGQPEYSSYEGIDGIAPGGMSGNEGNVIGVVHLRNRTLLGLLIANTSLNTENNPGCLSEQLCIAKKQ